MPATKPLNSAKPLVVISILHFRHWKETYACLQSCLRMNYPNYKIIVVDNDEHPQDQQELQKNFPDLKNPKVHLLQNFENKGFAGGHNSGIRLALNKFPEAQYFWLLNNDLEVSPDGLKPLVESAVIHENKILLGSTIYDFSNRSKLLSVGGNYDFIFGRARSIDSLKKIKQKNFYPQGAALFVSKRTIEEVGLIREDLFLFYEEISWAESCRAHNFTVDTSPFSKVYHQGSLTTGQDSGLSYYYTLRNVLKIAWTYKPLFIPTTLVYHFVRAILKTRFKPRLLFAYLRGGIDFVLRK